MHCWYSVTQGEYSIQRNDQCFNSEYGRTGEAVHYADHPCQYLYCRNWDHRYSHGLCFGQRGCRDGIPPDCGHFVLIFMCCSAVVFATQKEVVPPPVKHKYPLRVQFKSMLANRPFFDCILRPTALGLFIHGRGSMYTYYFKYVQGDAGLMSLYNLVGLVPRCRLLSV